MPIKHLFECAVADGADAEKVQPSNWNAEHEITTAAVTVAADDKVLIKDTSAADALAHVTVQAILDLATVNQNGTQTGLVTGGNVVWESAYQFTAAAAVYYIGGTLYSSTEQTVTLDAADAADDRIDVIALDTSGALVKVTGTPAAEPSKPAVDPTTQLELTFVLVEAASTAPVNSGTEAIYEENAEWTASSSGTGWTLASTNNPRTGTVCVEGTSVSSNGYVQFARGALTDLAGFNSLRLYLRSKAAFGNNKLLRAQLLKNGVAVGNALTIAQSTISSFGFDSTNTTNYQLVSIPISQFVLPAGAEVNQLRVTVVGGGIGFYVDDVALVNTGTTIISTTSGLTEAQADARYAKLTGAIFAGDVSVPDEAYDATAWNGSLEVPTKNAVRDKIEAVILGAGTYTDEQAQDAIGTILADSATIDFTYTDATPEITASVKDDSVTYAKIQNVSAADKILGRATAGAGDVEEIACTAAGRALLDDADAAAQRTTLGAQASLVSGTNIKTVNGESLLGSGDLAVSGGGGGSAWTSVFKTATTSKASNTTPAADPHLTFPVDANKTYVVRMRLFYISGAVALKHQITITQTPQLLYYIKDNIAPNTSAYADILTNTTNNNLTNFSAAGGGSSTLAGRGTYDVIVKGHATLASAFEFQWSQGGSGSATATQLLIGSYLEYRQLD